MGQAPRITNRERVLLALSDAPDFQDQYELPRRFSQVGIAHRLEMAQSHVSRALSGLIEENLLSNKRKRVVGERRRVMTYSLSEIGIDKVHDLISEIEHSDVLSIGDEGSLVQVELKALVNKWFSRGGQRYPDALSLADLLRNAEIHDGMPLLESPPEADEVDTDDDLSSEAIGLHLELAELRRSQGDLPSALDHLSRAGGLHRKRGNPVGEARCILAAASLGAKVDNALDLIAVISQIRDPVDRMDCALMLHDVLLSHSPDSVSQLLDELPDGHPEVLLRKAELAIRQGEVVSLSDIPKELTGASKLRQNLWRASYARIQCRVAEQSGVGWPVPSEVELILSNIGSESRQPHPLLYGELVLAQLRNPVISDDEKSRLLQSSWELQPPMPTIGHIGFQLSAILPPAEAMIILINLKQKFEALEDESGLRICTERLDSL
jgi:DNA-binding MarR family transcriptional regulator